MKLSAGWVHQTSTVAALDTPAFGGMLFVVDPLSRGNQKAAERKEVQKLLVQLLFGVRQID